MATTVLDNIKTELRVSGTAFDVEIQGLIDACKADLEQSGVRKVVDTEHLVKMAISVYCKANFGWDNPEAERFMASYISIRDKLALASDYNVLRVTFAVTHSAVALKGATINIYSPDGSLLATLTTDSKGAAIYETYSKNVDYDYTVSYPSYIAVSGSVYVDADESVAVSI